MNALADLRARVATALEPVLAAEPEWSLHLLPVDALTPPALMLAWSDPWLELATFCAYRARLHLIAISARLDPDPGIETLEAMIDAAVGALGTANLGPSQVNLPQPFDLGGLTYQAARILVVAPLTIGGT